MKRNIANSRLGRSNRRVLNPSTSYEDAKNLSKEFHGREVKDITEILESYSEPVNLAELGILEELVVNPLESKYEYPINFEEQHGKDLIRVCSNSQATQLYFIGGDQDIDDIVEDIIEDPDSSLNNIDRHYILLGICNSIAYFTDKHHLEGPKSQKYGCSYEHEFSEENPEDPKPLLIYDKINKRMMLLGGSYTVKATGIHN